MTLSFFEAIDEIIVCKAEGLANADIAKKLRCSESTVRNYIRIEKQLSKNAFDLAYDNKSIFSENFFSRSGILSEPPTRQEEIIQACIDAGSTSAVKELLPKKLKKKRPEQALYIQGWELLRGTRKFRKDGMVASVIQLSELTGLDRQYIRGRIDGYEQAVRDMKGGE
jgi:hypothetical protein